MLSRLLSWIKRLTALQIVTLILALAGTIFAGVQLYYVIFPVENQFEQRIAQILEEAKESNEKTKSLHSQIVLNDSIENTDEVKQIRTLQEECQTIGNVEVQLFSHLTDFDLSKVDITILASFLGEIKKYGDMNQSLMESFVKLHENYDKEIVMNVLVLQKVLSAQTAYGTLQNEVYADLTDVYAGLSGEKNLNTINKGEIEKKTKQIVIKLITDKRLEEQVNSFQNLRNEIMMACNQMLQIIKKRNL